MEHNFLPYGYKINCRKKLIIILRIILFTVIAINSITLYCVLKNINSRSTVCVKETENKKSAIVSKKTADKDITCLKTLQKIEELLADKNNYKKISVVKNKVDLSIAVKEHNEYENLIRNIENNENMKITRLCLPENSGSGESVSQITLEVSNARGDNR